MKLRFYPVGGNLVQRPGLKGNGEYQYVGRKFNRETRQNEATGEVIEADSESREGRRYAKVCRRDGALRPADRETAIFCGVPIVTIDGVAQTKDVDVTMESKTKAKKG